MFYDLAMRDVEIAVGAFALAQLSALREQVPVVQQNKASGGTQFAANR